MVRTIIVSNRLPFQIKKQKKNITYRPSIGGLATGLKSVHSEKNSLWLGWCGIEDEKLEPNESRKIENDMKNNCRCVPVFLSHEDVELFYNSFSNKTLWPLFHHFPMLTEYRNDFWQGYQSVNEKFFNKLKTIIGPKDRIW